MKKIFSFSFLLAAALLIASRAANAQFGGCGDSPENPTLVLAGLASGAFAVSQMRTRIRARRKTEQK